MRFKTAIISILILSMLTLCGPGSKLMLREVPREKRQGLMVLNFKNNTLKSKAEEFKPWEYGIASMVMTDIESIGLFNIISRERLKDVVKQQEFQMTGMVDPRKAVQIGKILAARYILTGSFMEMRGALRIEAQVISVETGAQLGASSVTGKTDTFFDLEKNLVIKISKFLDAMLSEVEKKALAGNIETKSVNASLNNYQGEIEYNKAQYLKKKGKEDEAELVLDKAKTNFNAALKYDPEYERAKENLSKITMAIPVTL